MLVCGGVWDSLAIALDADCSSKAASAPVAPAGTHARPAAVDASQMDDEKSYEARLHSLLKPTCWVFELRDPRHHGSPRRM